MIRILQLILVNACNLTSTLQYFCNLTNQYDCRNCLVCTCMLTLLATGAVSITSNTIAFCEFR